MGRERGPDFYNTNLRRFLLPLERSPWRDLYRLAVQLVPDQRDVAVADLGCGTGRFAKLLRDHGYTNYWGVDFAEQRVAEARRYVPDLAFETGSFFDPVLQGRFEEFDVFVLLETLEHLEQDLELLASLPAGAWVVLSVPDFDAPAHARFFPDAERVVERYRPLLDFDAGERRVCTIQPKRRFWVRRRGRAHKIFLFSARRQLP